jgi:hypothetical protein
LLGVARRNRSPQLPEVLAKDVAVEIAKWTRVIREANIKQE